MNAHATIKPEVATVEQKPLPTQLHQILPLIAEHDLPAFKAGAFEFASGMCATIQGAHRAMEKWAKNASVGPYRQAQRIRFVELLEPHAKALKDKWAA